MFLAERVDVGRRIRIFDDKLVWYVWYVMKSRAQRIFFFFFIVEKYFFKWKKLVHDISFFVRCISMLIYRNGK